MWHFFQNPKPNTQRPIALSAITAASGEGYVYLTDWGLPDTSVIAGAPAEYILELGVDLRKTSSDNWVRYSRALRYSSAEQSESNVLTFMPISTGSGSYEPVFLSGAIRVTLDSDNNRWRIFLQVAVYFSNNKVVAGLEGTIVNANIASIDGVNIYY